MDKQQYLNGVKQAAFADELQQSELGTKVAGLMGIEKEAEGKPGFMRATNRTFTNTPARSNAPQPSTQARAQAGVQRPGAGTPRFASVNQIPGGRPSAPAPAARTAPAAAPARQAATQAPAPMRKVV